MKTLALLLFLALLGFSSAAVIGIDFGGEWFKVMVIHGRQFDLILNEASGRRTATAIGWGSEGERLFGEQALALQARKPEGVVTAAHELLGINASSPRYQATKEHFMYNIEQDESRDGAFLIRKDQNTTLYPEEIVAMILQRAQRLVEREKGLVVKDVVITIPPYLTQQERQAWIQAAKIANMNVLALIHSGSAVALNYALKREFEEAKVDRKIIFYDMGASHTVVTLVHYKTMENAKNNKTFLNIQTVAQTWDDSLGGRDFDTRLAKILLARASEKIGGERGKALLTNSRAILRLKKEAKRAKEILSANTEYMISIESLTPEDDFSGVITREDFEKACADLFVRALDPVKKLIEQENLKPEEIFAVELVGGGGRIPKFQEDLKALAARKELDRHLNGDEAAVHGATFYATMLSVSFQVKNPLRLKDILPYPMEVDFSSVAETAEDDLYATIFPAKSRLTAKKTLSLRQDANFSFDVLYGNSSDLPKNSPRLVARFDLSGVPTNQTYNITAKPKIALSLRLDPSGMIDVVKAEAEINVMMKQEAGAAETNKSSSTNKKAKTAKKSTPKQDPVEEDIAEEEELEINKGDEDVEPPAADEAPPASESEKDDKADGEAEELPVEDNEKPATEETIQPTREEDSQEQPDSNTNTNDETEKDTGDSSTNENKQPVDGSENASEKAAEKEKEKEYVWVPRKQKVELKVKQQTIGKSLPELQIEVAKFRIKRFDKLDEEKQQRDQDKNALESYIYATRERSFDEEFAEFSSEEEREKLGTELSEAADWLDEDSDAASASEFRKRLRGLSNLVDPIELRISEKSKRPEAVTRFNAAIETLPAILANISKERDVADEEIQSVMNLIQESKDWLELKVAEQEALAKNQNPAFTSLGVNNKVEALNKELKKLLKKPKRKPTVVKVSTTEETGTADEPNTDTEKNVPLEDEQKNPHLNEQPRASDEKETKENELEFEIKIPNAGEDNPNIGDEKDTVL